MQLFQCPWALQGCAERWPSRQEGDAPPPLSPVVGNGGALMDAAMKPATPDAGGPRSTASLDGGASEAGSRAPSESAEAGAAEKSKEAKRKGRFQARPGRPLAVCSVAHMQALPTHA